MRTRREFLGNLSVIAAGASLSEVAPGRALAAGVESARPLIERRVPSTGEVLPVFGMGTSGTLNVQSGTPDFELRRKIFRRFFEAGGRLVETSPSYGQAEQVIGELLGEMPHWRSRIFIATKLSGVPDRRAAEAQFAGTVRRLGVERVDLLQIHNLQNWQVLLPLARELKARGLVRHVGISHFTEQSQPEVAAVMRASKPDFVQINYSVNFRAAEQQIFPLAQDLGIAVIANRNFDDGNLFGRVAALALPSWAAEVGIRSWAQALLRFCVSHPAVTAVIPSTTNPEHISDNREGCVEPLLDGRQRKDLITIAG